MPDTVSKSLFEISKMDCPSEENLIRMKVEPLDTVSYLDFDIPHRKLTVFHTGELKQIQESLAELDLGTKLLRSELSSEIFTPTNQKDKKQSKSLWMVLIINFSFFIIEMSTGWISKSMGLVADSLDMLADSFVYALSLMAVGASAIKKKRVAKLAGYFQIILALIGFLEVIRRFFVSEQLPDYKIMMGISLFALLANTASLFILQKSKSKDAHMQASMIFTSNDIIINIGVILAGGLVYYLQSPSPDLIIGAVVFVLVIRGALRILKLAK